jgi:peptidyl-prolyl cis-trans isomerase D
MEAGEIEFNEEFFEGVAAYESFRLVAAGAQPGDFAELIELDDGGIAVISVAEIIEPTLRPFDDVQDDVVIAWERAEVQAALSAFAEDLVDQIEGGRDMAALDVPLNSDRDVERTGFIPGTPPGFTEAVFSGEPDDLSILAADGDVWIVRLDAVNQADATTPEAQLLRAQFAAETAQVLAQDLMTAFTQSVVQETGISINQVTIDSIHATLP